MGKADYEMAVKNRTISTIFRVLSFGAGIAAISSVNNNRKLAIGLIGGQILFSLGGAFYFGESNKHLDRAIWQRNKDLLFPK